MIERFYLQENLSFKKVELEFSKGLILFTGASGAGKSVLMNSILGAIGQKESNAKLSEVIFNRSINLEEFGIESDEITVFKQIKKEKVRYFINSQTISKKIVAKIGKLFINHLNPRDIKEFDSNNLILILDLLILSYDKSHKNSLEEYKIEFEKFEKLNRDLRKLNLEIDTMAQKEDFIKYEISKINNIKPEVGEYDELQLTKKRLSKKDRIEDYIEDVEIIFDKQNSLSEIFDLMGFEDESLKIIDFLEDVKSRIEEIQENLSELDEINIEKVLNRIEKIAEITEKYETVEKALEYRDSQISELDKLKQFRSDKKDLQKEVQTIEKTLLQIASNISDIREKYISNFEESLNIYLEHLNLGKSTLIISKHNFSNYGIDKLEIEVDDTEIEKLSYGEQNRVRLAILTLNTKFNQDQNGTLFLDEIDANLSGNESMRVAKVLKELSKVYQVFAVSHQPQLTSQADQHFLVEKISGESFAKELFSKDDRAKEIIRMIGGKESDSDVYNFATNLLK